MSKFDYGHFVGGDERFAVNAEKYTKEEAVALADGEIGRGSGEYTLLVTRIYVRHRAGINEDNEPVVGWWLEDRQYKRSCPVYAFRASENDLSHLNSEYYECIRMNVKEAGA